MDLDVNLKDNELVVFEMKGFQQEKLRNNLIYYYFVRNDIWWKSHRNNICTFSYINIYYNYK